MSTSDIEEFNANFDNFKKIYEECLELLSNGIEQETVDEESVSNLIFLRTAYFAVI